MELTTDSLFDGGIVCYQNKEGYRFSIDAVLISHFAQVDRITSYNVCYTKLLRTMQGSSSELLANEDVQKAYLGI